MLFPFLRGYKLQMLWETGNEKLKEDFNLIKIMQNFTRHRCMFGYYKAKHSELTLQVNESRHMIINLDLETAFRTEPIDEKKSQAVLTKFPEYVSSEEEDDRAEFDRALKG